LWIGGLNHHRRLPLYRARLHLLLRVRFELARLLGFHPHALHGRHDG
jgi:hypothetical protein